LPPLPAPAPPRRPAPVTPPSSLANPLPFSWSANPLTWRAPPADSASRPRLPPGAVDLTPGPLARNSRGAPPRQTNDPLSSVRVEGAQVGDDWMAALERWWLEHRYYPQQALENGEDGVVELKLVVERSGHVRALELRSGSGSQWIDLGAQATFRGANLPPFPQSTRESQADVYVTIHYILYRR
jgi:protein TonB